MHDGPPEKFGLQPHDEVSFPTEQFVHSGAQLELLPHDGFCMEMELDP